MIRRASRSLWLWIVLILAMAGPGAGRAADDELPADGQNALKDDFQSKWAPVWSKLLTGAEVADPANAQHQQAADTAAKWATYRFTWAEALKDPGVSGLFSQFNDDLVRIRTGKDKTQKLGEMYIKQVIVHAQEVTKTSKPLARINAARLLARIADKSNDESPADALARLGGTNQSDLADAFAAIIKAPDQGDGAAMAAKLYAFRGLRLLLALPQPTPPALPPEKVDAALGEVIKFLQTHNQPFPPAAAQEEIDGFCYVRREAIEALAVRPAPTLATLPDKPHPVWVLLKIAVKDGVDPAPRLDERVEAAIGVARARVDLDPNYQPDYAAHQLGLFVADFVGRYNNRATPDVQADPDAAADAGRAWKYEASRLIEALELMKAQSKNAHVTFVVDESMKYLTPLEKTLSAANTFELVQKLQGQASPSQQLFKGAAETVVTPGGAAKAPVKPEEKKDK